MEESLGCGAVPGPTCSSSGPSLQSTTSLEPQGVGQQGILIQLTGTEGEWGSLDDSSLIFPLEHHEVGPLTRASGEVPCPHVVLPQDTRGLHCPAFHVPLSPSSPSSLGDFCLPASSFLSPSSTPGQGMGSPIAKPFVNLVKSLSTELESKEASSKPKPKPFLSLVKSISTEITRSEPEVSQSRSDSKLNLHHWRQFTQPKACNEDSRTAPPSPISLSPLEPKGNFFKVELEDTRRKFSEAVQEQLSMISKIIRDENSSSPKCQRRAGPFDSTPPRGFGRGKIYGDPIASETQSKSARKMDGEGLSKDTVPKLSLSSEHCGKVSTHCRKAETSTYEDAIQSNKPLEGLLGQLMSTQHSPPVPYKWLFGLAVLAYGYFILPLPSYLSGLSLGLACGFLLGLLLVLLLVSHHPVQPHRKIGPMDKNIPREIFVPGYTDPLVLKGWMNQIHTYDPEVHSPALNHSVYATLEGSWLCLARPSSSTPRWAVFSEPSCEPVFVHSCRYQLASSKVFLLPPLLARKRVWNKKYPICIVLAEGEEGVDKEAPEEAFEGDPGANRQAATSQTTHPTTLFLFGRTGREKEEWFQHFLQASIMEDKESHSRWGSRSGVSLLCGSSEPGFVQCAEDSNRGSTEDVPSHLPMRDIAVSMKEKILLDYSSYMSQFILPATTSTLVSPCQSTEGSPSEERKFICEDVVSHPTEQTAWINALIGRIFWDFLREKYWADLVAQKIQKKLSKIRLPYFMNELTLTELDLGACMPQVMSTAKPTFSYRGLWLELEMVYTGSLQMTLETKMNLCRLGKDGRLEAGSAPEAGSLPYAVLFHPLPIPAQPCSEHVSQLLRM